MFWFLFIIGMGVLHRLAGNGFGQKWGVSWLPELLQSLPFGLALGWGLHGLTDSFWVSHVATAFGTAVSYAGMQSAAWQFLRWEKHNDPNTERGSTLKPIIDFIAGRLGYSLGQEGYAWTAAGVKGFIIGLPVGGVFSAIFFMLGHEIGSHAKGRVERFGLDPHLFREFFSGCGAGLSIFLFAEIFKIII